MPVAVSTPATPVIPAQDSSTPKPQRCPVCGVAMIASRSKPEQPHYDLFRCLQCHTEIDMSGANTGVISPRN
jgi:hypothetical protein